MGRRKASKESVDRLTSLKLAYGSMVVDFVLNALRMRKPMATEDELIEETAKRLRLRRNIPLENQDDLFKRINDFLN